MSDDSGLDLYGWGRWRGLSWGRSWSDGLRGSSGGGCGQDSSKGQGGVLDRQVGGEECLSL